MVNAGNKRGDAVDEYFQDLRPAIEKFWNIVGGDEIAMELGSYVLRIVASSNDDFVSLVNSGNNFCERLLVY
jgi:hypothetical protein